MTLTLLYKKGVVYPGILLLLGTAMYAGLRYSDYHGEIHSKWVVMGMTIFLAFIYCLAVCFLSRTIFLTRSERVRSSAILSALCWFFLPISFMLILIAKAISELVTTGSKWEITFAIVACVPFTIGLALSYRKYKKSPLSRSDAANRSEGPDKANAN